MDAVDFICVAIDETKTDVREDAIEIKIPTNGSKHSTITIVSILPPTISVVDRTHFKINLRGKVSGHTVPFFTKEDRVKASLSSTHPKEVIALRCKINGKEIVETLSILFCLVEKTSYGEFIKKEDFGKNKKEIEYLLKQNHHEWYKYRRIAKLNEKEPDCESRALIGGLMNMFNNSLSIFAKRNNIPTIKRVNGELFFGVQNGTKFSAPLRDATNFINAMNLYSFLIKEEYQFTEEKLKEMGIEFKMV